MDNIFAFQSPSGRENKLENLSEDYKVVTLENIEFL